ncbi:MAG TPA: PAS domain S-box protein [Pseudolabrys sp.]|jgi:PAS domain S-box-containing protein
MDRANEYLASLTDGERYRLLVEAVTDYAIYLLDPSGIVTSWNSGAQRLKGYTASEIIGHNFSRFYTEEDRKAGLPARALETAAREGKFETEGWHIRKDGSQFWAYVVIDPIRHPSGDLIGFAKIVRDLTERKAAEQTLRRAEMQFRLLVQGVTDYAIYLLDPNGNVSNWNLGAQRIKGYRPDEIIGQHFSKFYTEEERAANIPAIALETVRKEGRFEREGWRVRKDGTRFWAHVIIDAIRDDDGSVIGYAKITRDITERKVAQDQLEKAREYSLQSQKLEAIGQLTGGIAHDFNNLLTAVLGSLELLRKRLPNDPRSIALLENAAQGAQRGTNLTKRMLAFARNYEFNKQVIGIPELVRGMTDLLQRSVGPSLGIETRFPLALTPIEADSNQLELALLNLTLNARDAMPESGVIVLSAREEDLADDNSFGLKTGRYICLSVTDTGQGMDEETLRKATEPFFTTKGVGKGTGLGLSMVHGFAEQSGGRLILHSQKNKGTTAELWLPVATTSADPISSVHARTTTPLRPLRIMAVDDDALVLMNTVAMLEDLGHTVVEAYSGKEALEILRQDDCIDLVVTDQAMPHMTGVELAKAMKDEWPDIPVLLATGYADRVRGDDIGLPKLTKPYLQDDLSEAIARLNPPRRKPDREISSRNRSSQQAS